MALPLKPKRLVQNGLVAHYAPIRQRNLLKWSEPLLAQSSSKSGTVLQANFVENSLSNGIQFPAATQTDYAYITNFQGITGINYTFSIFVVMDDGSIPNPGSSTDITRDFSIIMGGYAIINSVPKSIVNIIGNLYRVSVNYSASAWASPSCGVARYATQSGKGFRVTGYQLELSPSATTYQRTTDLQTVWNQKQDNMSVQNIVTNGNFVNTSGWIADGSTISVSNNIATARAIARYGGIQQVKAYTPLINKFYARAFVKADSNLVSLRIYDNVIFSSRTHSGSGNFELLSTILTCNNGNIIKVYTNDDRVSGWTDIQVKEVILINLTSLFGAGNEPTTQQCDEMFSSWFDGTVRMNLNRWNGVLGSTSAVDTNDPTFDGTGLSFLTDDYVSCGLSEQINVAQGLKDFTLCCVVKPTNNNLEAIFGKNTFISNSWGLYQNGGRFWFQVRDDGDTASIGANTNYTLGNWYFVCGRRFNNVINLFIGVLKQNTIADCSAVTINSLSHQFIIGRRPQSLDYYFNGVFTQGLVYNRALTDAEIAQNYQVIKAECNRLGVILP